MKDKTEAKEKEEEEHREREIQGCLSGILFLSSL